jgi:CheY-like chemotaxis protein
VVEDDPASREFARSSLAPFGIVDTARTLADAGALCADNEYALLLLDVSLPDGQGDGWLARQRALSNRTPAVALTAELDAERRRRLMASGFVEALGKPLSEAALRQALAPWLGASAEAWDDAQALSALGGSDCVRSCTRCAPAAVSLAPPPWPAWSKPCMRNRPMARPRRGYSDGSTRRSPAPGAERPTRATSAMRLHAFSGLPPR